jgi:hypothetical protein
MQDFLPDPPTTPVGLLDLGGNSLEALTFSPTGAIETRKWDVLNGKSIGEYGLISQDAFDVLLNVCDEAHGWLKERQVDVFSPYFRGIATAGLRDANNAEEVIRILLSLGLPLQIISEREEAILVYNSVIVGPWVLPDEHYVALEVGGGSTELAFGSGAKVNVDCLTCLPLGTGRLELTCLTEAEQIEEVQAKINTVLENTVFFHPENASSYHIKIKDAPEWQALFKAFSLFNSQELNLKSVQTLLSPDMLTAISEALPPQMGIKVVSKLLVIHSLLSLGWLKPSLSFGPEWGLKFGLLKSVMEAT